MKLLEIALFFLATENHRRMTVQYDMSYMVKVNIDHGVVLMAVKSKCRYIKTCVGAPSSSSSPLSPLAKYD